MKRLSAALLVLVALAATACEQADDDGAQEPSATPKLQISESQLREALLDAKDVGSTWNTQSNPAPSSVQIGGRRGWGPANVKDAEATAIAAFEKAPAYLITHLYLVDSELVGEAIMLAHDRADPVETWTQERKDGGGSQFKRVGPVEDIGDLGEQTYSARLSVSVTDARGNKTKRKIQYVVFRIDRIVAFVIAQDAKVEKFARRQAEKVDSLTA